RWRVCQPRRGRISTHGTGTGAISPGAGQRTSGLVEQALARLPTAPWPYLDPRHRDRRH
ncbi:hypothetical protein G7B11_29445, partial [Klebsiella pneumoniae]|nr:hypothetical protein [Klebsiella pneumoniae]